MKKTLSLMLALILALCIPTALAENTFPLTEQPVTFTALSRTNAFYPNGHIGEVGNMKAYEEMTNIHIEWEDVDPSVFATRLAGVIAGDAADYPDIIFKGNITNEQSYEWGHEGILVDLKPYMEEYMPNFTALCKEYPDILQAITTDDGHIYGLPQVVPFAPMKMPDKFYYNNKYVEASGLKVPTNTDELFDFLVAFRDSDFNGNGKADEVGISSSVNFLYGYFYGTFGLGTRGVQHNNVVDVDPETRKIRIFGASDNYRKFLEYMHKLYSNKLIYQEIYTEGDATNVLSADDRLAVCLATTLSAVPKTKVDNWVGLKTQLVGPDGYNIASQARSTLHTVGNMVVTSHCKDVGLILKWVDYFYGEEGSLFYHAGVKGVNWEIKEDGSYGYTDEFLATWSDEMTQDTFLAQACLWPGGRNPAVMSASLWGGEYEAEPAATAYALKDYAPEIVWPIISWTEDENEVISRYLADIRSYITKNTAAIVSGEAELTDEWWNKYVTDIQNMGADKVIDAYTSALTRIYGEGNW